MTTGSPALKTHPGSDRWRDHAVIFLVSAALIVYQLAIMRVLSVVVWYHFAFLTLSLVMLGLGAPGVWFGLIRNPIRLLPEMLLAGGIAIPLSVFLVVRFAAALLPHSLIPIILFILPAMLTMGGAICLLLMKSPGVSLARMYGADLLGAFLGAALVIPLMSRFSTPHLAAACGLLPLIALGLYPGKGRWGAIVVGVLVLVSLGEGSLFKVLRSKTYDETRVTPIYETWSPTARLTVFDQNFFYLKGHESGFFWGRGSAFREERPITQYWLEQDGSAGTPITAFDGDLSKLDFLFYDVTTVGYQVAHPDKVAIIGAGGGRDILSALLSGARDIRAIELNSRTISIVSKEFDELSGDIYHYPGVRAVAAEGRSYLARSRESLDAIQISLTDSWAASVAGTYALAENNLYTIEAMRLYRSRLTEDGILSISRWMREMPWLIALARDALIEDGVKHPQDHLAVVSAGKLGTLLVFNQPRSNEDVARLLEIIKVRGFHMLYPGIEGKRPRNPFLAETAEKGLEPLAYLGLKTKPVTDDRPYFFHVISPFRDYRKLEKDIHRATGLSLNTDPTVALRHSMIGVSVLAVLLFFVLPAWIVEKTPGESLRNIVRGSAYFAAIGAGFMLVENVLIQRFVLFLGHPSYAATVIIASLLLGMGLGSLSAPRLGLNGLRRWGFVFPPVLLVLMLALPSIFSVAMPLPLFFRVGLSVLLLGPLGWALGLFFPLGMLRFGDRLKPWFWAINGFFSVFASVMALGLSMEFGFQTVGLMSTIIYFLGWLFLKSGPRPAAS